MKFSALLAAVLIVGGVSSAPVISPNDISDFAAVIPLEKVWAVVSDYLAYDEDVKNLMGYIHTHEFKQLIVAIDRTPEFIEFLDSLEQSGYPAYKYWNIVHSLLGMPGVVNPNQEATPHLTGGLQGLVSDVRALLNEEEIKKVYEEKLLANPNFKSLVDHFQGQKFQSVLGKLAAMPEVTAMLERIGLSSVAHHTHHE